MAHKLNLPRFIGLVLLFGQLLLLGFEPLTSQAQTTLVQPLAFETDSLPGLQDIIASISASKIVSNLEGLTKFSRCMNAPSHDAATQFIQEQIKATGLTPLVQAFSSNAAGLRTNQLQNVVVRLPGVNSKANHLVTAHYDSSPNRYFPPLCDAVAPGANDNGSGVAVLLELARLFGQGRSRFNDDITLVFFDGEEFGYLGSQHFVQNFSTAKNLNPAGLPLGTVINLDMVGYTALKGQGKIWAVAQPGPSLDLARQGIDLVSRYAPGVRYNTYMIGDLFTASRDPNRLSDQQSFWNAGKGTAIFLTEDVADAAGADPRYHTPGDTLYNQDGSLRLDPALMLDAARVALAIVGAKAEPQPSRFFPNLNPLFERNWSKADRPVLIGSESGQPVGRGWLWGPVAGQVVDEPYEEAMGGTRQVVYFDKARMELRLPGSSVTNGLLVKELASGAMQLGDSKFIERSPSQLPVAGDPNQEGQNSIAPTYASFKLLVERGGVPRADGTPLTLTLDRASNLGNDSGLGQYAHNASYISNTGHNIPDVFWNWFGGQGRIYDPQADRYTDGKVLDWLDALGYPISEAYWVRTRIAGKELPVLVQLFERRILTYNPANEPAFRVEMGNVGQHYYRWRYGNSN